MVREITLSFTAQNNFKSYRSLINPVIAWYLYNLYTSEKTKMSVVSQILLLLSKKKRRENKLRLLDLNPRHNSRHAWEFQLFLSFWVNDYLCCTGIINLRREDDKENRSRQTTPIYSQEVRERRVIRKNGKKKKSLRKQDRSNGWHWFLYLYSIVRQKEKTQQIYVYCWKVILWGKGVKRFYGFYSDDRVWGWSTDRKKIGSENRLTEGQIH